MRAKYARIIRLGINDARTPGSTFNPPSVPLRDRHIYHAAARRTIDTQINKVSRELLKINTKLLATLLG